MTFEGWLDARDGEALARAWGGLDVTRVEVGAPGWSISMHGAARLAAAFLGWPLERLAWLGLPVAGMPAPSFAVERTTSRCFLEHAVDVREECYEYWQLREVRDGERGVQHVAVACRQDDGTREGSGVSGNVVRVFDRGARVGASVFIGARIVATIGDVDVAALDLFDHYCGFALPRWTHYDPDGVRGVLAQLATEIDAHFDVSPTWPSRLITSHVTPADDPASPNARWSVRRFEAGAYAVEVSEHRFRPGGTREDGWVQVTAHGLPWGHALSLTVRDGERGMFGDVTLRLPLALGEAVIARLARVPGVEL